MKRTLSLVSATLLGLTLMTGCATKPVTTVGFDPYVPEAPAFKKCGTVYISGVVDKRPKRERVGEIVHDGKPVTVLKTYQSMEAWFRDAVTASLGIEGCKITPQSTYADKIARIYIRIDKIYAWLDRDRLTGENLEASVHVTLFMRQGKSERIIKKIGLTQRKWVPPLSGESTVRDYLQETMDEVVKMIVKEIDHYRF